MRDFYPQPPTPFAAPPSPALTPFRTPAPPPSPPPHTFATPLNFTDVVSNTKMGGKGESWGGEQGERRLTPAVGGGGGGGGGGSSKDMPASE